MADDKTERTIQFILEQQAQNTVAIGQLTNNLDKLSGTVDKLSDKVDRTADGINALLAIAEIHEQEIAALRESVKAVSESVNSMRESISAGDERGRETDERLNALINTVERYISERRNGNASN
jgi:methyl-accepting chemotaxis protein